MEDDLKRLRKQLLAGGYYPLPGLDKTCRLKGWNGAFLAQELEKYGSLDAAADTWPRRFPDRKTTNIQIRDGVVVFDADIDDAYLAAAFADAVRDHAPDVFDHAPVRYGSGAHKAAWFCRMAPGEELFTRRGSRKFIRAGGSPDSYHHVEVFGGKPTSKGTVSRQFGCFGPHTIKPEVRYEWAEGGTLADIPLAQLPAVSSAQIWAVVHAFDEAAAAAGWEALPDKSGGHEGEAHAVYDIDRDKTRFDAKGHGWLSYAELEKAVNADVNGKVYCQATFIHDEVSTSNRCAAFWSDKYKCVMVQDFATSAFHLPMDLKPTNTLKAVADLLVKIKEGKGPDVGRDGADDSAPPEPAAAATMVDKVNWLLRTYGYYAGEDSVVELYAAGLDCRLKPVAFERRFKAWYEITGRSGAAVAATAVWERAPERRHLAGVRMRPDRAFPLYQENGALFKNTYRRPVHVGGGTVKPMFAFMERFLPDVVEREWFYSWLAHKYLHPEVPGTAIVLVADNEDGVREGVFGTGRGLLFRIVRELFGPEYVRAQDFSMMDGSSGQAVFNDWLHGSVLVTVDESRTSATAHRRGERSATYEVLKNLVDPAAKQFHFKGKYRAAFDGMSYASFMVATNHADALAIPAGDRRFSVLRNGRKMTREEVQAIVSWLEVPGNIGALAAWLRDRDLTGFNMYDPLETAGKGDMAEMALSSVDEVLADLAADEKRGLVFTKKHFEAAVASNFNVQDTYWRGELKGAWHRYCVVVKGETGAAVRLRSEGTQRKLFCFRMNAKAAREMPDAARRREAAKWGPVDGLRDPLAGLIGGVGLTEKDE